MKVAVLEISAELQNVTNLRFPKNYQYNIVFQCKQCQEKTNQLALSNETQVPLIGNNFTNLSFKCKFCSRQSNVTIIKDSERSYDNDDSGQFKAMLELDCRGCEPISFTPMEPLCCESDKSCNVIFDDIDLQDSNWADYNDKFKEDVGVFDFESRFNFIDKK